MSRDTEGDTVEVVNRTSVPLDYMYNGRQRSLKPGVNQIPAMHVEKARTQNVVMGSEDPERPSVFESYVACPSIYQDDDVSPLELPEKGTRKQERLDRSLLPAAQSVVNPRARKVERTALSTGDAATFGA